MNSTLQDYIDDLLLNAPPRAKSLIVSVLGDVLEPRTRAFWVGTLIELMAPFGINERSVRTSLQRLSQAGWLSSERHGRRSRYMLTDEGIARIFQARPRIYAPPPEDWDGRWVVIFAAPGSLQAWQRIKMRQFLDWEGYSMIASGVFAHPLGSFDTVAEILDELQLRDKIYVFIAESAPDLGLRTLYDGVGEFWDFVKAQEYYEAFIERFQPWLQLLRSKPRNVTSKQHFMMRLLMIHAFRRASLHAPRLPYALFPSNWIGLQAYNLSESVYQMVWVGAESYIDQLLADCGEPPAAPDTAFFERFGGLEPSGLTGENHAGNRVGLARL